MLTIQVVNYFQKINCVFTISSIRIFMGSANIVNVKDRFMT